MVHAAGMATAVRVGRLLLVAAAALGLCGGLLGCAGVKALESVTVQDVPLEALRDGRYTGAYRTFPVTVAVEVRRHFHGPGHGGEQIVDRVLAIREALEKGR